MWREAPKKRIWPPMKKIIPTPLLRGIPVLELQSLGLGVNSLSSLMLVNRKETGRSQADWANQQIIGSNISTHVPTSRDVVVNDFKILFFSTFILYSEIFIPEYYSSQINTCTPYQTPISVRSKYNINGQIMLVLMI